MLKKLIDIKEQERKAFKRHFIRNVILEIEFDCLKKENILDNVQQIQKNFAELGFNKFGQMKQIEFKMTIDKDVPEQLDKDNEIIGLLLFDECRKIRIELLTNKIIVSIFKYLNFDVFINDIIKMLDIIKNINPEENKVKTITLNKQNSIISTETNSFDELTFILNEPLLSSIRNPSIPFENFEYANDEFCLAKDNYRCKISSNCRKREVPEEYEINLNISVTDSQISNYEDITSKLKNINNFIFSVFCWATTEKFKDIMNEEN